MSQKSIHLNGFAHKFLSSIVKLIKNFRSHPDILRFPNERFYENELQPCGPNALIHSMDNSDELARPKFPLVFHSVQGKDDREKFSPSFFNIAEASIVKNYCVSLVSSRKNRIRMTRLLWLVWLLKSRYRRSGRHWRYHPVPCPAVQDSSTFGSG